MHKKIKAIFFDVDGTTYQHNIHDVPASTYAALKQLKAKGIKLAICTSRVKGEMIHLPQSFIDLFDGVITSAGALIEEKGKIIEQHLVDLEDAKRVMDYCQEHGIVLRWADNHEACHFDHHQDDYHTGIFEYLYLMKPTLKPYQEGPLLHLLFYPQSEQIEEIQALLKNSHLVSLKRAVEVTAFGISKASAIQSLATHWNVDHTETMAFGDGWNDIEMLKTAEIGVAMGNASDEVKRIADYVTDTIDQDGVAHALKHFQLID